MPRPSWEDRRGARATATFFGHRLDEFRPYNRQPEFWFALCYNCGMIAWVPTRPKLYNELDDIGDALRQNCPGLRESITAEQAEDKVTT